MRTENIAFRKLLIDTCDLVEYKESVKHLAQNIIDYTTKQELHSFFEMMFAEIIHESIMNNFWDRYSMLNKNQREDFKELFCERYEKYGEMGFFTIAYNILPKSRA